MTFREIMESDKDFLTPEEVRDVVGCMPYSINVQAKEAPEKLGFPVCILGTRVKIPRLGFIHWMLYGNAPVVAPEPGIYARSAREARERETAGLRAV